LPGFDIQREHGRGGMGVVYLAHDRALRRPVAIKMLISGEFASETARGRFRNEAEAAARLKHPNIVEVFALGEHDGRPYLVQEFVAGGNLDQRLDGTPLEARTAAEMIRSLADAVQHAHSAGIVHRDLKPANVLVSEEPAKLAIRHSSLATSKIADFGLAKQIDAGNGPTATSQVLGTPSYMAPEQARGTKDSGPAVDIYALGAIFYECLTGRPPFKAATPLETLTQSLNEEPVAPRALNPAVPRDLETVCLKCLAKEPEKRYLSASALADDLARFLEGRPVVARPIGPLGRAWRWAKRRPAIAGLIAALILVIGGALAGLTSLYISADRDRRAAETNLVEARANLRVAVDAIDRYFVRVSGDGRLKEHDLRALRQSLLQSAAEFHEQLLTRHADDPQLQTELAKSLSRLGLLTAEIDAKPRAIDYYPRAVVRVRSLAAGESLGATLSPRVGRLLCRPGPAVCGHSRTRSCDSGVRRDAAIDRRIDPR
jgi:tRNA A-37 threonylcarbamoyl transferase component Bud32